MSLNRRSFLQHAAAAGAGFALPLERFWTQLANGPGRRPRTDGYGPIAPVEDRTTGLALLALPAGFTYASYGWTGDPMDDGTPTPPMHDGMAAFEGPDGRVVLVRNHEAGLGPTFAPDLTYDSNAAGGTTNLVFDPARGEWVGARASLSGTVRNCAGGPTPWGTWLTCEETLAQGGEFRRRHGYIFEVPVEGRATRRPLVDMGRFVHEAVAVDPATGIVYETEDAGAAGLYRFIPSAPGDLARGGTLEMLAIDGRPQFDTRTGQRVDVEYPVSWVRIGNPDRAHDEATDGRGVYSQGFGRGGATFARLEGAWHGDGRIYVTATSGGDALMGQVWELDPARARLRLVFESPGQDVLSMPDNICMSPRGGLVICEDGPGVSRVHGLTTDGQLFDFARNIINIAEGQGRPPGDYTGQEFAGATYSPDGRWLFFNVQTPGVTFAITGPWEQGLL